MQAKTANNSLRSLFFICNTITIFLHPAGYSLGPQYVKQTLSKSSTPTKSSFILEPSNHLKALSLLMQAPVL